MRKLQEESEREMQQKMRNAPKISKNSVEILKKSKRYAVEREVYNLVQYPVVNQTSRLNMTNNTAAQNQSNTKS